MEISKTKIKFDMKRKTNPMIVEAINLAKKQKPWLYVAKILSSSTRKYSKINLQELDKQTKEGDTVIVIGKVLGKGEMSKRIRICALSLSGSAKDKLKKSKAEIVTMAEEIKKNPKAEGIKIIG